MSDPDTTWTVPATNPWASAQDTLPEIWASGVRNPYRLGFDALTGDLWIGDVGQNAWEEVDFWPAGENSGPNFGWRCYEGDTPFNTQGCQGMSNYEFPVTTHENVATGGTWCSSIGGRVYRGTAYPRLAGRHIYTDYCAGEFWMITPEGQGGWVDELGLATGTQGTCKKVFKLDEAGFADILKQVRDHEFEEEINKRLKLAEKEKENAVILAEEKLKSALRETLARKEKEMLESNPIPKEILSSN